MIYIIIGILIFVIASEIVAYAHLFTAKECIVCLTGTNGSGKSYIGVQTVISRYRFCKTSYYLGRLLYFIKPLRRVFVQGKPVIYSNIPIRWGSKKHYKYSNVLTLAHLTLKETFPPDVCPIVLIDEIGSIANQYSFDDINVTSENVNDNFNCLENFIRYFRHFYGENNHDKCLLVCNDQNSNNIAIPIRRRFSSVTNLSHFRRMWLLTRFYKVDYREMICGEDMMTNINNTVETKEDKQVVKYYCGILPYRWEHVKLYDSHCYSNLLNTLPRSTVDWKNWYFTNEEDKLKTSYISDIRSGITLKDARKLKKNK